MNVRKFIRFSNLPPRKFAQKISNVFAGMKFVHLKSGNCLDRSCWYETV